MHRRPTLTQRDGLFRSTRYVLYGNRVRVIRVSPLVRDDQFIPLDAVDPDERVTRRPDLRTTAVAVLLMVPSALAVAGWPAPASPLVLVSCGFLALGGLLALLTRGGPVRTYVEHGALQLLADVPDTNAVRHFVSRVVDASREQIASDADGALALSVAGEIRRLHDHLAHGHLSREGFERHKLRLIRSLPSDPS